MLMGPVRRFRLRRSARTARTPPQADGSGEFNWIRSADERIRERLTSDGSIEADHAILISGLEPLVNDAARRDGPTLEALQTAAVIGYVARGLEHRSFRQARHFDNRTAQALAADLAARADGNGASPASTGLLDARALAAAACRLAREEAIDPRPSDAVRPTCILPGIGPDLRRRLRERNLVMVVRPDGDGRPRVPGGAARGATFDDFRRAWKYGFLTRGFEELFR